MSDGSAPSWSCPLPDGDGEVVRLADGGGGRAMQRLLARVIRPLLDDPELARAHDGAVLDPGGPIAFTTDSFVVRPLFFPGGDIGRLAVCGTANDLAMCGAEPLALALGLVLEEGLPTAVLRRVVESIRETARDLGLRVVTGDLKVVERGKADGLYVTTTGIGRIRAATRIDPAAPVPGDLVLVSGDVGRHGVAVLAAREDLGFDTEVASDCAPVVAPVLALLDAGVAVRCLRDPTRGGTAAALVEIAETAGVVIRVEEAAVPVREEVRAACELLGFDPLHLPCEGRFLAFVAEPDAARALAILRRFPVGRGAAVIGRVEGRDPRGRVLLETPFGQRRPLDMPSGEQLPRIC